MAAQARSSLGGSARALCLACLASLAWGCDDAAEQDLSVELVSQPPEQAAVEVAYPRIRLPAGMVLAVEFHRQGGPERELKSDAPLSLYSDDPSIARSHRTLDNRRFLIVGRTPGDTIIRIALGEERLEPLIVQVSKPRSEKNDR